MLEKGKTVVCNRHDRCNTLDGCKDCPIYELYEEKLRDNFRE